MITYEKIKKDMDVLSIATWPYIISMIRALPIGEFDKIPKIESDEQKKFCELYGICDIVDTGKDKYINVYCIYSYIFRGEEKEYHVSKSN